MVIHWHAPDICHADAMAGYLSNQGTRLFDHSRCRPPPGDDLRAYAEHLGPWRKFVSPRCPAGDMCVASQPGAWRMTLQLGTRAKETRALSSGDGFASCSDAGPACGPLRSRRRHRGARGAAQGHSPQACHMRHVTGRGLKDGVTAAGGRSCCPIRQTLSTIEFRFERSRAELSSPCRITSFR